MLGYAPLGSAPLGSTGVPPPPNATVVGALGQAVWSGLQPTIFWGNICVGIAAPLLLAGDQGQVVADANVINAPMGVLHLYGDVGTTFTAVICSGITLVLQAQGQVPTIYSSNFIQGSFATMTLAPAAGSSHASSTSVQPKTTFKLDGQVNPVLKINRRRTATLIRVIRNI